MKNILLLVVLCVSLQLSAQERVYDQIGGFNEVKVYDLIEVNLIKSNENKVLVKGWNVDDITVTNKKNTLRIRMKLDHKFQGDHTVVEIHYTHLDVVDGNEGSKIVFNEMVQQDNITLKVQEGAKIMAGLDVKTVEVRAVTGGIVQASGLATQQSIVLNTGGIFEGRELKTQAAKVKITAAGEAEVYSSKAVDINVKAGGNVYVYGDPQNVNKSVIAGGNIYMKD